MGRHMVMGMSITFFFEIAILQTSMWDAIMWMEEVVIHASLPTFNTFKKLRNREKTYATWDGQA